MKSFLLGIILITALVATTSCNKHKVDITDYSSADTGRVASPDHVIMVWFENKGFSKIIGSPEAPYINSLVSRGTLFTNSNAITHPSYPNYIAFFSGELNRINSNNCIEDAPLDKVNLYAALKKAGKSFAWYSEDLPAMGSKICRSGEYVEKHNPVTIFSNVADSANKPFSMFPTDYNKLENVVCITPNLMNDMHDGSIAQGDQWLKTHLSTLADWCMNNNSIFVVYFDETESETDYRIPVVAVGEGVKSNFATDTRYDHYSWTKTLCLMFGAKDEWTGNLQRSRRISDCWK